MKLGQPLVEIRGPLKTVPEFPHKNETDCLIIPDCARINKALRFRAGRTIVINEELKNEIEMPDDLWPLAIVAGKKVFPEQSYLFLARLLILLDDMPFIQALKRMQPEALRGCYAWPEIYILKMLKMMDKADIRRLFEKAKSDIEKTKKPSI